PQESRPGLHPWQTVALRDHGRCLHGDLRAGVDGHCATGPALRRAVTQSAAPTRTNG
nr:hypothetical protein [Tanacetum cinerariifolium]